MQIKKSILKSNKFISKQVKAKRGMLRSTPVLLVISFNAVILRKLTLYTAYDKVAEY